MTAAAAAGGASRRRSSRRRPRWWWRTAWPLRACRRSRRAAGVSLGTLSYHFESKDELIREILDEDGAGVLRARQPAPARASSSPLEAIVLLATCHFEGDALAPVPDPARVPEPRRALAQS